MGATYTRQSSYTDGDVIQASDTNNEFDQLLAAFNESTGHTHDGTSQPLVRQSVEGSGFTVALRVNDGGVTAPYSLKGFQLEYQVGARR